MKRLTLAFFLLIFGCTWLFGQDEINPVEHELPDISQQERTISERINDRFEPAVRSMEGFLFYDPLKAMKIYDPVMRDDSGQPILDSGGKQVENHIPIIILWLIFGAVFFTIFMKFVNIRGFGHAIALIRGRYDNPKDDGEVSHFQALATALSGTVGLGNIAGVAVAIAIGGPGATIWMIIAGFLGMSSKFVECTLGVKYRNIDNKGEVSGGPMYYLSKGLAKRGKAMGVFGKVLAAVFAVMVIGGSFGGGNMFQANQAYAQLSNFIPMLEGNGFWFGLLLAILTGVVIIGGIRSIANVTDKLVPFMAVLYVGVAIIVIAINYAHIPEAFAEIWHGAFNPGALKGGLVGVLIMGFRRAAFSNEAGIGSASIAHSAVKTQEPITEGLVSLLEPFIDTVVICTMTALVIVITGEHHNFGGDMSTAGGVNLTSLAFQHTISWFPYLLTIAVFLFAFSTMISWSYYGLKGFDYLFGGYSHKLFGTRKVAKYIYQVIFLAFIVVGTSSTMSAVIDFSDMMIFAMAFPNILGLIILAPEVRRDLKSYFIRVRSGEIKKYW
ncbi:MAG: alanine/glycine:cation symporter family protein [Bacteroidales bacterium]